MLTPSFLIAAMFAAAATPMQAPLLASDEASGTSNADQIRARQARQRGEFVALEHLLSDARRRQPGELVEVELEGFIYEIEVLRADGRLVELEYDARTGQWLGTELDD